MRIIRPELGLVAALVVLSLGAQAQSSASNEPSSSIRSVDFLNFSYKPGCISGRAVLPQDSLRVTTKNGAYESPAGSQQDVPIHFTVNDVLYGALRGDGTEQAVVVTGCNLGGTGYWTEAFVFELRAGQPVAIESVGGGDRAMGGIKSVRVDGRLLKVAQQYGVALCCADYIETTTYQLRGNRLVPVGSPKRIAARNGQLIKPLRFERGTSSGIIKGKAEDGAIYELRARAGQTLVIERLGGVETKEDIGLGVMDPDGMVLERFWDVKASRIKLPSAGLYTLVVSSSQSNVPYAFKVTIH